MGQPLNDNLSPIFRWGHLYAVSSMVAEEFPWVRVQTDKAFLGLGLGLKVSPLLCSAGLIEA